MKPFLTALTFVLGLLLVTGCASTAPEKTSLELQAIQKREFQTSKPIGFASTLSVFQDLGYTIKAADIQTGLIQAQSPTKNVVFFGSFMSNTDVSAFVEEIIPGRTSIRLNFVAIKESSSGYGMKSKEDRPVLDPKVYENAFAKIQEAIFIRKGTQ